MNSGKSRLLHFYQQSLVYGQPSADALPLRWLFRAHQNRKY